MSIVSIPFALFVAAVFAACQMVKMRSRWVVLTAASVLFVLVLQPMALAILAFTTATAFVTGLAVDTSHTRRTRAAALWAGLAVSLVPLGLSRLLGIGGPAAVGIAFYTLRLTGYVLDVFHGRTPAERNPTVLVGYAAFFPEFLAGPIERPASFLPRFRCPAPFDAATAAAGMKRVAWGLLKKAVVAERLAAFVDPVYASPQSHGGTTLVVATVCYAFQIYYDFSGYTDIILGVGRIFGLRLTENFDRPYASRSVSEFWRRWHISLSSWLRDYLFLPLAYAASRRADRVRFLGSAASGDQATYAVATLVTMLAAGLWHGFGWTFVAWSTLLGGYLVSSRMTKRIRARIVLACHFREVPRVRATLNVLTVFTLMSVGWVFFRAESIGDAVYVLLHFGDGFGTLPPDYPTASLVRVCMAVAAVEFAQFVAATHDGYVRFMRQPLVIRWGAYFALVVSLLVFGLFDSRTFIYARF